MHRANSEFWAACRRRYPPYFNGPNRVLEVGSLNVNGSVRKFFTGTVEYVGVDWRPGRDVDMVCLAEDMRFDHQFDVVISASTLEHDPFWRRSLIRAVQFLAPKGILLLSWGGALVKPHCHSTAPDGRFHPLPAHQVVDLLNGLGIYVHQFRYELSLPYLSETARKGFGRGCVVLVGFRSSEVASDFGMEKIDPYLPEDST